MDHEEAVARQAAERYVLGELSDEEREAFEEHFFDCPECARDVQACAAFLANARALLRERESGWRGWAARITESGSVARAALAAGLLLLAFTAYLWLVRIPSLEREIAALRAPQSYAAFFLRPVVRGEDQTVTLSRGAAFLGLAADVPPGAAYPSYRCELLDESGRVKAVLGVAAPAEPGAAIHLLLPRPAIRAGRHTLVLHGVSEGRGETELARFSFLIQVE